MRVYYTLLSFCVCSIIHLLFDNYKYNIIKIISSSRNTIFLLSKLHAKNINFCTLFLLICFEAIVANKQKLI